MARAYNLIQQEEIETEREVEGSGQDVSDNLQEPTEGIAVSILVDSPESTLEGSERTSEIPSGEPINNELTVNPPIISLGQAGTQSNQEDMYSKDATADSKFTINNVDILSEIISGLKSYNWYEQNSQIDKILSLGNLVLPNTQKDRGKVFVVGRNIYQAASGGAFKAMEFIENLESNLAAFNDFISNHLYSGMFYEIYFNSKGEFRNGNFKAAFYEQLFKLQTKDRYQTSINFIFNSLNEYSDNLLVLPSPSPNIVNFHIYTEPKTDDFFGVLNKVTKITAGQKELLTENTDFHFSSSITEGIKELQDRLRHVFLVPAEQSSFIFYPENRNSILYFIPNNKSLMIRRRENEAFN